MTSPGGRTPEETTVDPAVDDHHRDAEDIDATADTDGSGLDEPTRSMPPERGAETDAERTEWIPVTDDRPTGPQGPPPRGHGAHEAGDDSSDGGRRRPLLIGAAVVGLLAVLYVGDLLISSTDVPRGVAVAGVEIGGMGKPEAEQALNAQLAGRLTQPVTLQAGPSTATIDPRAAGLELDVEGTIARAGEQPFNPWTRLTSLFGTRDVAPVTRVNGFALGQALDGVRPQLDRPATEGTIRFENLEPVAVQSVPGQVVDGAVAAQAVTEHWLDPTPVGLPIVEAPVTVTPAAIQEALDTVARPAVAGPLTVVGDGKNATVTSRAITTFLTFRPDGQGGLTPGVDEPAAIAAVEPQLGTTETEPRDATLEFGGTTATVVPAVVGREIDWPRTFEGIVEALRRPDDGTTPPIFTPPPVTPGAEPASPPPATGRAINAVYTTTQPEVTTESLQALGPATLIGEFTTRGFKPDSGQNIRRIAEIVNGKIIEPNSVFSLNRATSPRNEANGFVPAGIIDDGAPGRGVGGGVSQFATTQPEVTTESLQALGPATLIGEFTTRGFKPDSGQNIRRIAEIVNGKIIAPNSVFSLNEASSPRNEANGFVPAGIIDDGAPGRGVGGGVSQFATTLFNAGYLAGLDDVEHKEHSYYISRYPAGREATVFEGSIDLRLGNDGPTPVYIRTQWTPSSITVQLYGIKRFEVTSEPGPRVNPTPPGVRDLGANPECKPSQGSEGFTITDTRVLRDVRTGEVRREPRTVRYEPQPTVTCNGP